MPQDDLIASPAPVDPVPTAPPPPPRPGLPQAEPVASLGLPSGWFLVAQSAELRPGVVLARTLAGHELVVYRTSRDCGAEARVQSAFCPHLGAHLGRCGSVRDDVLRCGFHGFLFDGDGACVATMYGTRPPPRARLLVWPTRESHGAVLAYYHPRGEAPTWEMPRLDMAGWSTPVWRRFALRGHPQETTENSVDLGHLTEVHGYRDVAPLGAVHTEGPLLRARYRLRRDLWPLSRLGAALDMTFTIHAYGLGCSLVELSLPRLGVRTRQFVFATPTQPGRLSLCIGMSVYEGAPLRRLQLPGVLRAGLLARALLPLFRSDIERDFAIWEHKRYVHPPALAEGDGPVGVYRRWARQFY